MMQWLIARVLAGAIAAVVMALVIIGILVFTPPPVVKLQAEISYNAKHADGVVEKHDLFGLLQAQWTYRDGLPNGVSLHYYPNRSIFRELQYVDGKLEGEVRAYYQKERTRGRARYAAMRDARSVYEAVLGDIKGVWNYRNGKREGSYTLYNKNGYIKEEGQYRNDKRFGRVRRYSRDGRLASDKYYGTELTDEDYSL